MEIIANALQTVEANQNVLFTDTVVGCSNSLLHRTSSGLVTLRGNASTQCRARYRVFFSGNIGLPAGYIYSRRIAANSYKESSMP